MAACCQNNLFFILPECKIQIYYYLIFGAHRKNPLVNSVGFGRSFDAADEFLSSTLGFRDVDIFFRPLLMADSLHQDRQSTVEDSKSLSFTE